MSRPVGTKARTQTVAPTDSATPAARRTGAGEASVTDLVRELSDQMTRLARQEVELAKAELTEKGRRAGVGAGMFGGAGVVGLLAAGALTACFILALDLVLPGWLAALVVAVVYGLVAGTLALEGRSNVRRAVPPLPEGTTESVREDVAVVKRRASEGRR